MTTLTERTKHLLPIAFLFLAVAVIAFFLGRRSVAPRKAALGASRLALGSEPSAKSEAGGRPIDPSAALRVKFEEESLKLAGLKVEPVGYRVLRSRLAVTGTVEPNLGGVVKITPRVAGKITSIPVNVGDAVLAGQVLALMNSTELAEAQAAYRQALSRVSVTQNTLRRQRQLARLGAFGQPKVEEARSQAVTTQGESNTAHSEVAAASAEVAEVQSQLKALQSALTQAETQVKVTESRFHRADLLLREEVVSRQDWEQAQADQQRAQADVETARANIGQGQAKIETAGARLEAARAKLSEARKRRAIAAQFLAREEKVFRGGYLTSKELVEAESAWRQARLDLRAAADKVFLLGGTPGDGNLLKLTAPISGRVTERSVSLGETVTPEKPLFTVIDLRTVWVQLSVYPKDLSTLRVGHAVAVRADTAPGRTFFGAVSHIGDVVDETTRTVKVRAVIRNAGNALKPGTFVRGTIAAAVRAHALAVPRDAVQTQEGHTVVFVQGGHPGEFHAHAVQVGDTVDGRALITSGLAPGDLVVTRGAFLVKAQAMKSELGEHD